MSNNIKSKKMRAFIKENNWLRRDIVDFGWGNGYVVIPKGHPLNGIDYEEIHDLIPSLEVNGGLTFSKSANDLNWDELPSDSEDGWVVGFDTAHDWDTLEMWSKEAVMEETKKLKTQLEGYVG